MQKIYHEDPRIGFLSASRDYGLKGRQLEQQNATAIAEWVAAPGQHPEHSAVVQELRRLKALATNNILDAVVAGIFLILVSLVLLVSVREWWLLLSRRKLARLCETTPVWLPDYAVVEGKPLRALGFVALGVALTKELAGEAALERAQASHASCACHQVKPATNRQQIFLEVTEQRFRGVRRCC
jgi:carbon starvation protein